MLTLQPTVDHLEGVRLAVVGQAGELGLGILLGRAWQGEELLVDSRLPCRGETLPWVWVSFSWPESLGARSVEVRPVMASSTGFTTSPCHCDRLQFPHVEKIASGKDALFNTSREQLSLGKVGGGERWH